MSYDLTGFATLLLAVATAGLAFVGWKTAKPALENYQRQRALDEVRWLYDLFERFYGREEYRRVYLAFDGLNPRLRERIERVLCGESDEEIEWDLTRYFNFFEFVSMLSHRNDVRPGNIDRVFKYPITLLAQPDLLTYLKRNDYSELHQVVARKAFAQGS